MLVAAPSSSTATNDLRDRLRAVISIHFDRKHGSPFWLDRAAALGIDPVSDVRVPADLRLLGDMTPADLADRPLSEYVPRRFHDELREFVVGQTGGTTGRGVWTAYRRDEFIEAFVEPFRCAAERLGFPSGETWLYVGPSGPHIIGRVVTYLAASMNSGDPFTVDLDSRWAKKLPHGSFAGTRYLQHVVDQAMHVLALQPIGVLFTTPVILKRLADIMTAEQRARIRGVHYGGMAISPHELRDFQTRLFPNAVHLSGYGNTLFGCCLELSGTPGRQLDYYPLGSRLLLDVVDPDGAVQPAGVPGRVRFTRLDESFLIVRMLERDMATSIAPPSDAPDQFVFPGLSNPISPEFDAPEQSSGLY